MFTTYQDVLRHLDALGLFHMDLTLERMIRALRALGLERPPFRVAQIVGTNGKGSTSTFLASLAKAHGVRVGLYTSPHFVLVEERIRINGLPLPPEFWPSLANRVMAAEPRLTYFEFLTVLAVLAFAEAQVDLAVLEAGLGGHWDATTAVAADLVCFTPIGMDHEAVLGSTLEAIATDKAHALRTGVPALSAPQWPEAWACLDRKAFELGAPLRPAADVATLPPQGPLGLAGPHQGINAQLALAAWIALLEQGPLGAVRSFSPEAVRRGLRHAFLPGRLQRIPAGPGHPAYMLDGAHNPHGMLALRQALDALEIRPGAVVFSCLEDKDFSGMLEPLAAVAGAAPVLVPAIADNPRAAAPAALATRIPHARPVPRLVDALEQAAALAQGQPVLVCGSLYLLAEFFVLHPQWLAE